MLMSDFLTTRRSVRTFKNKKIDQKSLDGVQDLLDRVNPQMLEAGYFLYANGDEMYKKLEGKAGYGGVMIKAPAYIALVTREEVPEAYIYGAYYLEKVITSLKKFNLASCWVTLQRLPDDEAIATFGEVNGRIMYLLAIGYPPRDLNIGKATYSSRIGIQDYVFKEKFGQPMDIDELEQMGLADLFYYLRLAPSSYNNQPWRFVIDGHRIELYSKQPAHIDEFVDMGIILFYFDSLAQTLGIRPEWTIDIKKMDGDYEYIGEVNI
ncbi:MAG: nitroreductase family protein [Tissierellia bacterium]|nr:nitroreductase family protein [Tissierellia bacterium]